MTNRTATITAVGGKIVTSAVGRDNVVALRHGYYGDNNPVPKIPTGLGWTGPSLGLVSTDDGYTTSIDPRSLVNSSIWEGGAYHVSASGDDSNTGLGVADGDFSNSKRSVHAAITEGNLSGAPYRVIVEPGNYSGSFLTKNGNVTPTQPLAIIGWNGIVSYRTGDHENSWSLDAGGTYTSSISSVNRLFRSDILEDSGSYAELTLSGTLADCQATVDTWFDDGGTIHVNIGKAPTITDIVVIRNFRAFSMGDHSEDFYLENMVVEGGLDGAIMCEEPSTRNIVGNKCVFGYSATNTPSNIVDAVRIRRVTGLVAFFDSTAVGGTKDGWNFHSDGSANMLVLLDDCVGTSNGSEEGTSSNGFTTHDDIISIVVGGVFEKSINGSEVHCIDTTKTWLLGSKTVARDGDGTSTGYKCSTGSTMWLQNTTADASGSAINYGVEANGGTVFLRNHVNIAGDTIAYSGGSVTNF